MTLSSSAAQVRRAYRRHVVRQLGEAVRVAGADLVAAGLGVRVWRVLAWCRGVALTDGWAWWVGRRLARLVVLAEYTERRA